MAEGIMNNYLSSKYEAFSAGTEASEVNRFAIAAMCDIGIDIGGQYSKSINDLSDIDFDIVVTVCDDANEKCPVFLKGNRHIHKSFRDPAVYRGADDEKLNYFKDIRDQIKEWIISNFN